MSTEQESQLRRLVEQYIGLLNNPAARLEDVKSFLHAEIVWQEMPNSFAPTGRRSDYEAILATWEKGREFLPQQEYTLRRLIVSGDTAVLQISWRGKVSKALAGLPPGTELSGQIATFLEFREGKIISQIDYPCYDPIPGGAA
jgi:predicted ester cyclase